MTDTITLLQKLIACASVTPVDAGAQEILSAELTKLGFTCHHLPFSDETGQVPNLFARLGTGSPHICFAGHTDVVLVAAVAAYLESNTPKGSISLLITGDEEDLAVNGTVRVLKWMDENGHTPDVAIVGQHLADNPMPRLIKLTDALAVHEFDQGNEFFPPTNLEITSIDVGNEATNIIPAEGRAAFNIRFNDQWSSASVKAKIIELLDGIGAEYEIKFEGNAESFITKPAAWSEIVRDSVADVTGRTPEYTTSGGTSDARFVVNYCPTIECGAINESIHQVDENAKVSDLEDLTKIYTRILERYFAA